MSTPAPPPFKPDRSLIGYLNDDLKLRPRHLAIVPAAAVGLSLWLSPTFRAIAWGATWGNNMAAIEWGAAGSVIGYAGRDHIGAKLAAWWAKHHGPHAIEQHREALRRHEEAKREGTGLCPWPVPG